MGLCFLWRYTPKNVKTALMVCSKIFNIVNVKVHSWCQSSYKNRSPHIVSCRKELNNEIHEINSDVDLTSHKWITTCVCWFLMIFVIAAFKTLEYILQNSNYSSLINFSELQKYCYYFFATPSMCRFRIAVTLILLIGLMPNPGISGTIL